jgi:predicted S18 family serine protease
MKRLLLSFGSALVLLFSGCSVIEEVNRTIDYVSATTAYINELNHFANELPQLTENAIANVDSIAELENRLIEVKQEIETFIVLEAPDLAGTIHEQLIIYSEQIKIGIEEYLQSIEMGVIDLSLIETTEIIQTVRNITNLLDQLEQLNGN